MKHGISILCTFTLLMAGCAPIGGTGSLEKLLQDSVVDATGKMVAPGYVLNTDYLMIYVGAQWNPACKAFTPDLVNYYNEEKGEHLFQVLFVSDDTSEREMMNFVRQTQMPWPSVLYHSRARKKLLKKYNDQGIPRLILVRQDGKIIEDSFHGSKYVGPQVVLDKLDKMLGKRKKDRAGISEITGKALPTPEKMAKRYKVEGIGDRNGGKMAIINGKVREKGDELDDGIIIESITSEYVEISLEKNRYRLKPQEK